MPRSDPGIVDTCIWCGSIEDLTLIHGSLFCPACTHVCVNCHALVGGDEVVYVEYGSQSGEYVCSDCSRWCEGCEESISPADGTNYCAVCREDMLEEVAMPVDGLAPIRQYSYKPEPIFHGEGPLFCGIEQEMEFSNYEGSHETLRTIQRLDPEGDLLYVKHDGSLNGTGLEIITHPMSPDWFFNDYPWELQQVIADNGGRDDGGAGMHIHVNRNAFSKYHLWKFTYFHYANPELIKAIAGRDTHWAKFTAGKSRKRMSKPGATDLALGNQPIHEAIRKGYADRDRYMAVNLCNRNTVELRVFHATYDPEVMKGYVDYIKALYDFTALARIRNRKNPELDLSGLAFRKWAVDSGNYPHFTRLIEIRDIPMESLGKTVHNTGMEWKEQ